MYIYIYTREALLSEAGFEKVSGPRIGSVGASKLASFLSFRFVWWLDCLLVKEGPSAFCGVR